MAYKVKRHKKIYRKNRSRRFSPFHIILTVLIAAVLFFVGWSIYQPVVDFITGKTPVPSVSSSEPEDSSVLSSTSSETSQQGQTVKEKDAWKSAYLPLDVLKNETQLDRFITSLKDSQINAVVVDLKDKDGTLHYLSQNAEAVSAKAVASDAVDLSGIIEKFKKNNIKLIARIHAFQDHIMPYADVNTAVKYQSADGVIWLDDYYDNGGKAWMNPYSEKAQQYISDLLNELSAMGIEQFLLDSVQFPDGVGLNLAYYPGSESKSRQQVLSDFIQSVTTEMEAKNCKVSVCMPAEAFIGDGLDSYDGNAKGIQCPSLTIDLRPSQLEDGLTVGNVTLNDPVSNPYSTVKTVLTHIKSAVSNETELSAVIQAEEYTTQQISDQIKALHELSVESYLLYSENGEYIFD